MRGERSKERFEVLYHRGSYLEALQERGKTSKVYQKNQLVGLEIAELLNDPGHKSLYMKLAKERNTEELLGIAKDIASKKQVRNKGAYFMKVIHEKQ